MQNNISILCGFMGLDIEVGIFGPEAKKKEVGSGALSKGKKILLPKKKICFY